MPELARLTWTEAGNALAAARLALVPAGSCEQHGPHLTLDTDLAIADAFARRLAGDLGDQAILCPPLPYGLSEHHMAFAGTLTLRPETFAGVLSDVVESLSHWGVRRVVVVNGHGGNVDAIRLGARSARRDQGVLLAGITWIEIAGDEIAARVTSARYGHACEVETSVAMVLAGHVVLTERIDASREKGTHDRFNAPPRPVVDRATMFEEWTEDGALGDPRLATPEFGRAIVDAAYSRALAFAKAFADEPLPERGG